MSFISPLSWTSTFFRVNAFKFLIFFHLLNKRVLNHTCSVLWLAVRRWCHTFTCTRSINSGSSLSWERKLMISFMVPTKLGSVPSSSSTLLSLWNTTNTMMLDEHIQSYRISFELTKPLQSGTMKRIISFLCALRLDPELMQRVHMNVWHHRRTANHNRASSRESQRDSKLVC